VSIVNIARAVLTSGSAHVDVHTLGSILADRGYATSVSRGENAFGIVDESVLTAVAALRNAEQIAEEDAVPGVPPHERARWIGPNLWDALVTPAGKVKPAPKG
jgi:hypothetical protein